MTDPMTLTQEHHRAIPAVGPDVKLINHLSHPYHTVVAAAKTCYSPDVVFPDDIGKDAEAREQRDRIARSTYKAGHHTLLQHTAFQFVIRNISRHCVWSFLHSHPFYNSEQVSQRYVPVSPERFIIPPISDKAFAVYKDALSSLSAAYSHLVEILRPAAVSELATMQGDRTETGRETWIRQRCQEMARYVLPVATQTQLYHTINGLTLFRYQRLCESFDAPWEQRLLVRQMVEEVSRVDPDFIRLMDDPLPLEQTPEYSLFRSQSPREQTQTDEFITEFDDSLQGHVSKLVDYNAQGETTVAQGVRTIFGVPRRRLPDDDAIRQLMDPKMNPLWAETLNIFSHGKLSRALTLMHLTFRKKLSLAADSQNQRHRLVQGARPVLAAHFRPRHPDYIIPSLIRNTPGAVDFYQETMDLLWKNMDRLRHEGAPAEYTLYLLPNAATVRFEESGDLLSFHHKWTKRLCYLAQEEIWRSSLDEITQCETLFPALFKHIGPPCTLRHRAEMKPFCPEGKRFCGTPVWTLSHHQYERTL